MLRLFEVRKFLTSEGHNLCQSPFIRNDCFAINNEIVELFCMNLMITLPNRVQKIKILENIVNLLCNCTIVIY